MHPDRGIIYMDRWYYILSTRPDNPNTLSYQSAYPQQPQVPSYSYRTLTGGILCDIVLVNFSMCLYVFIPNDVMSDKNYYENGDYYYNDIFDDNEDGHNIIYFEWTDVIFLNVDEKELMNPTPCFYCFDSVYLYHFKTI